MIIRKDKAIEIQQKELVEKEVYLRKYLIGNEYDVHLIDFICNNEILKNKLLITNRYSFLGLKRATNASIANYFAIPINDFNSFSNIEKTRYHEMFAIKEYLNSEKTDYFNVPYIYSPNSIREFDIPKFDGYVNKKDINNKNFQRTRTDTLFEGEKILFGRFGTKIQAAYVKYKLYFSTLIYVIKLKNHELYPLVTAILNSKLINYYISIKSRKRPTDNFPNIETRDIKEIPIPKNIDKNIQTSINELVEKIITKKIEYNEAIEKELNNLIFDLYDLDILEKTRILDFFAPKRDVVEADMVQYEENLLRTMEIYFKRPPIIQHYLGDNLPFQMIITVIFFNGSEAHMPSGKKALQYINYELMQQGENFIAMKEKVFGNDCIYIIKDNNYQNWTLTKAFEDGQDIIKKIHS